MMYCYRIDTIWRSATLARMSSSERIIDSARAILNENGIRWVWLVSALADVDPVIVRKFKVGATVHSDKAARINQVLSDLRYLAGTVAVSGEFKSPSQRLEAMGIKVTPMTGERLLEYQNQLIGNLANETEDKW